MRVIGTAGHVDHGKSTLVKRLTGIDPDRLAEEKARQMTIDLGFAWLMLDDERVGIIDVPGHRDFIENMLAGVGGIDAALLVIAADEGVMPQTREHLAILDLLQIEHAIVVMTKIDAVPDPEWIALIEADIRDLLSKTHLAGSQIIPVSAHSGAGIDSLLDALNTLLNALPPARGASIARLPVDRVFSVSGFGTVVTGTLLGGELQVGDEVEILPAGISARIRGLQSYNVTVQRAEPGRRVAINLSGIERDDVARGNLVTLPNRIKPTTLCDVRFRHLDSASRPLKHNAQVKFFVGAAETNATVRLLSHETLHAGQEGWIQLKLDHPIPLVEGDRFILRYPSPAETIGGGWVVDAHSPRKWKRLQTDVITRLKQLAEGTPSQRLARLCEGDEPKKRGQLLNATGWDSHTLDQVLAQAIDEQLIIPLADGFLSIASENAIKSRIHRTLEKHHAKYSLRLGLGREELRTQADLKPAVLNAMLERDQDVVSDNGLIRLREHHIQFSEAQAAAADAIRARLQAEPFTPPSPQEITASTGEAILQALLDLGEIVQVQPDVIFSRDAFQQMIDVVRDMLENEEAITASALRDRFSTSRKYAIGLLEYLDSQGYTRRVGDNRVRGTRRFLL